MTTCRHLSMLVIIFILFIHGNTHDGIKLTLIHRFSPALPFHEYDDFHRFLERNVALTPQKEPGEGAEVPLGTTQSADHLFFVNVSVGDPPIPQYLAMDTGSRFVWVTGGHFQKRKYTYSPLNSSTFHAMRCNSLACKKIGGPRSCDIRTAAKCTAVVSYADGQMADIDMGSEQLVFDNVKVEDAVIGVNWNPRGKVFGQSGVYGVLGLAPLYPSFTNSLYSFGANKFSFYIDGDITRDMHPRATLTLGDLAEVESNNTTPLLLQLHDTHYQVGLQSISLGEAQLDIKPEYFVYRGDGQSGVIIDTGSVLTYLADGPFNELISEAGNSLVQRGYYLASKPQTLCFHGSLEDLKRSNFPVLSFNFAGGARLELDEDDLFMQMDENFVCLTMKRSAAVAHQYERLTIIGLAALQDYVMGFDLDNARLSMELSDF